MKSFHFLCAENSRFLPENYLSHHLAGIVTAAVFADARHIVEEITLLKLNGATPAGAARPTLPSERVAYSSIFTEPCRLRAAHASCV